MNRLEIRRTIQSAGKMLQKIRDAGLIESPHAEGATGNVRIHSLISPYDEMIKAGLTVTTYNGRIPISEDEILYVAILRNRLMIGQQLHEQHRKVYPDRSAAGIKNIVMTARRRGLCR